MPLDNPSSSSKKRKHLTIKGAQKKTPMTRQPTSIGQQVMSSTATKPSVTQDKNITFDAVNETNFCMELRNIDLNTEVDNSTIQQYLAVMHKSLQNNFGEEDNISKLRVARAKKDKNAEKEPFDVVTTTNQPDEPSIYDTQSYRCLVEDYMLIKNTYLLVLIPTTNNCVRSGKEQ